LEKPLLLLTVRDIVNEGGGKNKEEKKRRDGYGSSDPGGIAGAAAPSVDPCAAYGHSRD